MKNKNILPNIGERLVVHGMSQTATVCDVLWDHDVHDWKLSLDWGQHGKSRVWARDENSVWYRWSINS